MQMDFHNALIKKPLWDTFFVGNHYIIRNDIYHYMYIYVWIMEQPNNLSINIIIC